MRIVIVDAFTLNPGDLSWEEIENLGSAQIYERTHEAELVERCKDADIILTNKVPFSKEVINQLSSLKLIAVTATGYNIIDIEAAASRNITVCNVPDYGTDSVAQHTFALILELTNSVGMHATSVDNGDWVNASDFSYTLKPLIELAGKTIGLIGLGSIGKKTAEIAKAFGMKVLYHTPLKKYDDIAEYRDLESIFKESDFVSLHLPLKPDNKEFVNSHLLDLMKPTAFLINTSRGALINEQHLADALNIERIAGAALDVLSVEPPVRGNPLLSARNCIITPHNAWMSTEARQRIMTVTVKNVKWFLEGRGVNQVF